MGKSILTRKDIALIGFRGALKAIPYAGSVLDHFIFSPLTELRMRRIERTLSEVMESLGPENSRATATEPFATLLESVMPALARAVTEDKRRRFRDLLTNAAALPPDADAWEEADLASTLLKEVGGAGLAILAGIAKCERGVPVTVTPRPTPQVYSGTLDRNQAPTLQRPLPFDWLVVEYWTRWLREKHMITYSTIDAHGGFGGVTIAYLGEFLVKWTMRDVPTSH